MSNADFTLDEPLDIGSGVTVTVYRVDGQPYGLCEMHKHPNGGNCSGFVRFDTEVGRRVFGDASPRWKVESLEPLTLSPSILCRTCGHHGYVRSGKWVAA